ncbi:MAG: hypothetical protein COS84_01660 [Armatimonadetes bacterium CG07_land_8_20_14_0_80_40_9]|nr:MAG: hypothetical protein COS84_01660 [Armatimonadetes bacterium CG07_land_8_20_14_0_80_40_9]
MKKLNLYIETSVFGFYYDEDPRNLYKREATIKLFDQIKEGLFNGYISDIVLRELLATSDLELRENLRDLSNRMNVLPIHREKDVEHLSNLYIKRGAIPPYKRDDAVHVAIVVINPEIDILVSWNCKHIVNAHIKRNLKSLTEQEGYKFGFDISTPEEVVIYDI